MCLSSNIFQIQWTSDCTRTLYHCKVLETRSPLKKLRRKQVRCDNRLYAYNLLLLAFVLSF